MVKDTCTNNEFNSLVMTYKCSQTEWSPIINLRSHCPFLSQVEFKDRQPIQMRPLQMRPVLMRRQSSLPSAVCRQCSPRDEHNQIKIKPNPVSVISHSNTFYFVCETACLKYTPDTGKTKVSLQCS